MNARRIRFASGVSFTAALLVAVPGTTTVSAQNTLQAMPPKSAPMIASTANRPVVVVTDKNGEPIPYATVSLGGGATRITDTNGELQLNGVSADSVRLIVKRIGFREHDMKVGRPAPEAPFRVALNRVAQSLDAVEVKAKETSPLQRTGFYERMLDVQRGATVGEFFTPEMLQARSSGRFSNLVQGSKFLKFQNIQGKMVLLGRSVGANSGSGDYCNMNVVLDGMRINGNIEPRYTSSPANVGGGAPASGPLAPRRTQDDLYVAIDELVSGGEVTAIEVYPSTANAPSKLQPLTGGGSCGLVAIWTGGRQR